MAWDLMAPFFSGTLLLRSIRKSLRHHSGGVRREHFLQRLRIDAEHDDDGGEGDGDAFGDRMRSWRALVTFGTRSPAQFGGSTKMTKVPVPETVPSNAVRGTSYILTVYFE